jgi:hypothetical protein
LLDADHIVSSNPGSNNKLKEILEEYGAVIINIVEGTRDMKSVESFISSLEKYTSLTRIHVGLGLMISQAISREAKEYASKLSLRGGIRINRLLLIEKPSLPLSSASPSPQPFQP